MLAAGCGLLFRQGFVAFEKLSVAQEVFRIPKNDFAASNVAMRITDDQEVTHAIDSCTVD